MKMHMCQDEEWKPVFTLLYFTVWCVAIGDYAKLFLVHAHGAQELFY